MVRGVATTGQEKQSPERHLFYAFYYLLPVAKQLRTYHSSGKMQGCKVSTGKWMLSVKSQGNIQRQSKTHLPAKDCPSLMDIPHTALAYTTTPFQYRIKYVLYALSQQATTWLSFRLQFLRTTTVQQLDRRSG